MKNAYNCINKLSSRVNPKRNKKMREKNQRKFNSQNSFHLLYKKQNFLFQTKKISKKEAKKGCDDLQKLNQY